MGYVHVEVPLALRRPPARRHEQGGFVWEINLKAAWGRCCCEAAAPFKIEPDRAERLQDAVHAELETAGIGHTAEIRFIANAVFTDAGGDGCIETHAGSEAVVGIRP